jgi:hypothetical protein
MEIKTVLDSRMYSLIVLFDMHTRFYHNVIDGISDQDAHNRLNTKANHIAWIAGSLVYERYGLASILDNGSYLPQTDPHTFDLFNDHKGIQDDIAYPSLAEYKKEWDAITPYLRNALANLSSQQLAGPDPYSMPGEVSTLYDTLAYMIDRESYYIGQIGLYRRLLGYPAMKYQ